MSLNYFFNPEAVAILGASSNKKKIGRQVLDNISQGGFKGRIYPINLQEKKVAGLKAYPDLLKLPKQDFNKLLLVIAIPAQFVVEEIKKCVSLGIKNVIIISAGFKEAGADGINQEKEIISLAEAHKINILGPNCLGLINTFNNLNASFAASGVRPGKIALLSQSGAVGSAALDWLRTKDFNLAYFVSLGNKAVLDENDLLEYLAHDKRIEMVVAYLEEISDGERFMSLVSRLAKRKPVAILKAGSSSAGGEMAKSHTGSLAGSNEAVISGLKRAGAICLNNLEELFNLLFLFQKQAWKNKGLQDLHLLTNAGGPAVLTVDALSRKGLSLGSSLDLLGDADALRYENALNKLLENKKVNNVLVLLTPQTVTEPLKTAEIIVEAAKKYPNKLIMASFIGGGAVRSARSLLEDHEIPFFEYPEEAIETFKQLNLYKIRMRDLSDYRKFNGRIKKAIKDDDYLKSLSLLKQYGISTVKTHKYKGEAINSLKFPVVLKAVGPDFLHKTEKGGVVVNLKSEKELKQAARNLLNKNSKVFNNSRNYLVVQNQASKFQEIIIGFKRDVSFGPIMMVGLGGIYAEIFKEVKLEVADLDFKRALLMIKSLKIYPILDGARGQKKYNVKALAKVIVNLAKLANEHPEIKELDINPAFIFEEGVLAGDVRIIL